MWLRLISGLVMSIGNGVWLETFLNNVLGRNHFQSSTRPAFLSDQALALADSPEGNATFPSPMLPKSDTCKWSLNANSGNGGVDWFNSGPPQWGRGRAITKLNKTTMQD